MENVFKKIILLFAGVFFFVSCDNNKLTPIEIGGNEIIFDEVADEIIVSESQFKMANMKLGQLMSYDFLTTIRATGRIEIPSKSQMKISAYAGGYVTHINLIPGEKVRKGQILFTLENPELVQIQQEYLEAKEQLTFLKSDYERQKTLASENIASQKNYLKAESAYRVTMAKMEGMKKRLSLLNISTDQISAQNLVSSISISSPSSGYVKEIFAMKGMFLNPTDVAIELVNTDHLHLELNVFEKDILKVKKGQQIRFRIPDASLETFEAEVYLIGKIVDEEKRVVSIHGYFKNKKDKEVLLAGMYVDAEIIIENKETIGLPESAIVSEDGKDFVLIRKDQNEKAHKFEKKEVTIGQRKNGYVEVLNNNNFTENEKILIEGAFNLIGIE